MTIDLLTANGLTSAVAILLSLVFIAIPPARHWFVAQLAETQQAVTAGVIFVVAFLAVGAGCAGIIPFIPCTAMSIGDYLVSVVLTAIAGNQVAKGVFTAKRFIDARSPAPVAPASDPATRDLTPTPSVHPKLLG
jgi:hypothetical protein